jgi:RNA polymerase sigma factor (TIGR02999 family)
MSEVTRILSAVEQGDPHAAEQLLPLVYEELRRLAAQKMAQEAPGRTLEATALVHEAYIRLVESERRGSSPTHWDSRGHFFAAAAEAMRRILINRARDNNRLKRGGGRKRLDLDRLAVVEDASDDELVALDEALEQLARENNPCAELVKLRFFAGLTLEDAARSLGIARRTADRYWAFARAWLYRALRQAGSPDPE